MLPADSPAATAPTASDMLHCALQAAGQSAGKDETPLVKTHKCAETIQARQQGQGAPAKVEGATS